MLTLSTAAIRSAAITFGVILVSLAAIAGGLLVGATPLSPTAAVHALLSPDGGIESIFVWTLRLPRSLAAFVGGAGLGVSGCLLQTLTRNPLAGPHLTGVTAGAVAPIVACIVLLPSISPLAYPWIGCAGGLAAALVTFWIARGARARPLQLALGGVSVSIFLAAVTTYLLLLSGPRMTSLLFWLSGGFQGRSWVHLTYMAPWVVIGLLGALAARRIVGLMALDDATAAGMGVQLALWKPVLLLLAVLPVAGVAPIGGPIAFVGLATPHIARLLRADGPGWTIALAAALGGFLLVVADLLARSIAAPREIPVGILTALIGGPIFIALVLRPQAFQGRTA